MINPEVIERALRPEEDRIKEIEDALVRESGTRYLTAEIKRSARRILNEQRRNEPSVAQALKTKWEKKWGLDEETLKKQPKHVFDDTLLTDEEKKAREAIRERLKNPEDTTYHVEKERYKEESLQKAWAKAECMRMRCNRNFWPGFDDEYNDDGFEEPCVDDDPNDM